MYSPDVSLNLLAALETRLRTPIREHVQDPNMPRQAALRYSAQSCSAGRTRASFLSLSPFRLLYSFCREVEVDHSIYLKGGSVHTGSDLSVSY